MDKITEEAIKEITNNSFDMGAQQVAKEVNDIIRVCKAKQLNDNKIIESVVEWLDRYK